MRRTNRYQFEKPKEENKPSVKETKKRTRISPPRRKIYSFRDLKISDDCGSIDLTKKSIETFVGLPSLEYLIKLNLDSNPLRSFEGSPKLPNLRWLSARNSPISRNPYFKLMAVIVFGNKLATINNEKVMPQIYQQAAAFRESLYPELLKGRVIANLHSLRFIDTKNDIIVNAEPSILQATKKIGYKTPAVQEFERTIIERSKEQFRIPSVATICDGIIEREDEENNNYFPVKFMDDFLSQLHDLRVKYNAKYENSSSEYDDSEEAVNESTQSQESINDASPNKQSQADSIAKHLIRSESDSEIKLSQSNIEEEEANDNVSYHSNLQDNLLIEEEEEKNEQIESEKKEEEENEKIEKIEKDDSIKIDDLDLKEEEEKTEKENSIKIDDLDLKEEEEKIEKDDSNKIDILDLNEEEEDEKVEKENSIKIDDLDLNEEEDEMQKIQTLEELPNEEEEGKNEKENENNGDSIENQKESNEEENENEIEKANNENELSINLNEEEEEEKTETQNKNEEEEDKKIEIQNNSEEEEKNKSADDKDTNLSENSSVKDED